MSAELVATEGRSFGGSLLSLARRLWVFCFCQSFLIEAIRLVTSVGFFDPKLRG